jgi:hypothetical protein
VAASTDAASPATTALGMWARNIQISFDSDGVVRSGRSSLAPAGALRLTPEFPVQTAFPVADTSLGVAKRETGQ